MKNSSVHNQDEFLQHRKNQESDFFEFADDENPLSSLLTIEFNITELCNRVCVFCPRHDPEVYPNQNINMTVETAETIAKNLSNASYRGKISFSGFGESFLNKKFTDILSVMRKHLKNNLIECNTNGDRLSKEYAKKLFESGLNILYINLYDGIEQIEHFEKIMLDAKISKKKYKFRSHYSKKDDYGLKLNNRGGNVTWLNIDKEDIEDLKGKPCHYPFYKMFVDWNGDVLLCCSDWGKEVRVGNLVESALLDVWFGDKLKKIRQKLSIGDRSSSPCNKCSVNGQLFGKESFDIINEYY